MTTRAIGRISGNLNELMKWAHAHERKGSEIAVVPLGKDRWQITVSIPDPTPTPARRFGKAGDSVTGGDLRDAVATLARRNRKGGV